MCAPSSLSQASTRSKHSHPQNPHAAVMPLTELYNTKNAHRGTQPKLFKISTTATTIISLLTFLALCHPSPGPYHPQMTLSQLPKFPRDSPCSDGTCTLCQGLEKTKPHPISAGGSFIMAPSTNASMAKDRHLLTVEIENNQVSICRPL